MAGRWDSNTARQPPIFEALSPRRPLYPCGGETHPYFTSTLDAFTNQLFLRDRFVLFASTQNGKAMAFKSVPSRQEFSKELLRFVDGSVFDKICYGRASYRVIPAPAIIPETAFPQMGTILMMARAPSRKRIPAPMLNPRAPRNSPTTRGVTDFPQCR